MLATIFFIFGRPLNSVFLFFFFLFFANRIFLLIKHCNKYKEEQTKFIEQKKYFNEVKQKEEKLKKFL